MKRFAHIAVVVVVLTVSISPLMIAPRPAHAQFFSIVHDPLNYVQETLSAGYGLVSSQAETFLALKASTLDAVAWSLAQQLIQSLTASVVNWINGGNSGGFPLYVQNLPNHLLNVADAQALAFFNEFNNSNSPYASVILSSLRNNYLYGSSAGGFWAANQCTLYTYSSDPNAFIAGDFSKGGWGAWFSLTTEPQNDPYLLYYRTQAELTSRIDAAQSQALAQLGWGQGFLSWCGSDANAAANVTPTCPAGQVWDSSFGTCTSASVASATTGAQACPAGQVWNASFQTCTSGSVATAVGQGNCTKPDGTQGFIQTPGSVIYNQLDQALGTTFERLVNVNEINEIVGALVTKLVTTVTGDAGLHSASVPQGGPSLTAQIAAAGTGTASQTFNALTTRNQQITQYQTAWQTVAAAARTAQTNVQQLAASCPADATDAQNALTNEISPVLAQASAAGVTATNAQNAANKINPSSPDPTALQNAFNQPPSAADVTLAQQNAQVTGSAFAISSSTLSVSGGSLVDQMNLIATNAQNDVRTCGGSL